MEGSVSRRKRIELQKKSLRFPMDLARAVLKLSIVAGLYDTFLLSYSSRMLDRLQSQDVVPCGWRTPISLPMQVAWDFSLIHGGS